MELISKKELLSQTGISYGQLYRWKREGLIPEEWFIKQSAFTGQETFFPREPALARVRAILEMKDDYSLEELKRLLCADAQEMPDRSLVDGLAGGDAELAAVFDACLGEEGYRIGEAALVWGLWKRRDEFGVAKATFTRFANGALAAARSQPSFDCFCTVLAGPEGHHVCCSTGAILPGFDPQLRVCAVLSVGELIDSARVALKGGV